MKSVSDSKPQEVRFLPMCWCLKCSCCEWCRWQWHIFQEKNCWWHGCYALASWGTGLWSSDHETLKGGELLQGCTWIDEAESPRLSCLFGLSLLKLPATPGLWHSSSEGLRFCDMAPLALCNGFSPTATHFRREYRLPFNEFQFSSQVLLRILSPSTVLNLDNSFSPRLCKWGHNLLTADSLSSLALLSFLPCPFFLPNTEKRFFCHDDLNETIPQVWLPQTTEPQSSNPYPVSQYERELDHFSFQVTPALPLLLLCPPPLLPASDPGASDTRDCSPGTELGLACPGCVCAPPVLALTTPCHLSHLPLLGTQA